MNFIIISIILTVLVGVILTLPFWYRKKTNNFDSNKTNLAIFKTQITELEQDLAEGKIQNAQYEIALGELKESLGHSLQNKKNISTDNKTIQGVLLIVGTILCGLLLYLQSGNYSQITTANKTTSVVELVKNLENKLKKNPDDAQGWWVLGGVYLEMNLTKKSVLSYRNANKYKPNDSDILTQLAYTIAADNQNNFTKESSDLLNRALTINPDNQDANYLIGKYYFQQKMYHKALSQWNNLLPKLNPNEANSIKKEIAIVQQKINGSVSKKITVTITVANDIKYLPNETVFISAYAQNEPKIPLAVTKLTANNLPKTIILDKAMAVVPNMTINTFNNLVIKARISKSNNTKIQPGDRYGQTVTKNTKKPVLIVINKIK